MFIGASPGSTGGGIKTTTFAVIWISIFSILTGKRRVVLFKKNVPFVVLNRALIVFVSSITLVTFFSLVISISDNFNYLDILFEVTSALGTVGLSRGITANLSIFAKYIIILTMFIGRVGILSLTYAITTSRWQPLKIEYPSEMINIG